MVDYCEHDYPVNSPCPSCQNIGLQNEVTELKAEVSQLKWELKLEVRVIKELKKELDEQKQANANNLEGWQQNVAGLQRKIVELEAERDKFKAAEDLRSLCSDIERQLDRALKEWNKSDVSLKEAQGEWAKNKKWAELAEKNNKLLTAALKEMCKCFEFSLRYSVQGKDTKIGKAYQAAKALLAHEKGKP